MRPAVQQQQRGPLAPSPSAELGDASGTALPRGAVAYAPQQPALLQGSLKLNILFGLPEDKPALAAAVYASGLADDVASMQAGLDTHVAEQGGGLSGGQRARVGLARAAYAAALGRAGCVVLDDPLAGVSPSAADAIFERLLAPGGLLDGLTRIVAVSSPALLPRFQQVIDVGPLQAAAAESQQTEQQKQQPEQQQPDAGQPAQLQPAQQRQQQQQQQRQQQRQQQQRQQQQQQQRQQQQQQQQQDLPLSDSSSSGDGEASDDGCSDAGSHGRGRDAQQRLAAFFDMHAEAALAGEITSRQQLPGTEAALRHLQRNQGFRGALVGVHRSGCIEEVSRRRTPPFVVCALSSAQA